ncbi:MAG: Na+/H+ antiporter subunit E [Acidilobaceae archaeon]
MWTLFSIVYLGIAFPPREMLEETLIEAMVVTLFIAIALSGFLVFNPYKVLDVNRIASLLSLSLFYLKALIESHLDVAKAVIDPRSKADAAIVSIEVEGGEYVLVALAHLITNTPGTVVIDLKNEGSRGTLYVHWLNPTTLDDVEAKNKIVGRMEELVRKIID